MALYGANAHFGSSMDGTQTKRGSEAVARVYNSVILVRVAVRCFVRCTTLLPLLRPWNFRFGLHSSTWAIAPCSRTLRDRLPRSRFHLGSHENHYVADKLTVLDVMLSKCTRRIRGFLNSIDLWISSILPKIFFSRTLRAQGARRAGGVACRMQRGLRHRSYQGSG